MNRRVLLVDDDHRLLDGLRRTLRGAVEVHVADSAAAAMARLSTDSAYAVVLTDQRMPGGDGLSLLEQLKRHWPNTVRMMLTGNADQRTAIEAVNTGSVFRFLTKPCDPALLRATLEDGLRQHQLVMAEKDLLEKTLAGSLRLVADLLDLVDDAHAAFNQRVAGLLKRLDGAVPDLWQVQIAATVANLGTLTVPPATVAKLRRGVVLDADEREAVDGAPVLAGQLLANIPRLDGVAKIVSYQHKHYDGGGLPADSLCGDDIPHGARLLKLVTDLAAAVDDGLPMPLAVARLHRHAERYDPQLLHLIAERLVDHAITTGQEPVATTVNQLQVGQRVIDPVVTKDGRTLVAAGMRVTKPLLARIRNFHQLTGVIEPLRVVAEHDAPVAAWQGQ